MLNVRMLGVPTKMRARGYLAWVEKDPILNFFVVLVGVFSAFLIYSINRARKRDPDRILWFLEWLEWKLFHGFRNQPSE